MSPISLRLPVPELRWPGGRLRPWRGDDAESLVAAWTDPEVGRWNPVPNDPSPERAAAWIATTPDRLDEGRSLDLCLVEDDDVVLGEVGLSGFDQAHHAALIGYWLLPEGRGRGLAAAAVRTVSDWAAAELDLRILVARCATANLASHAVARRAGYTHARRDDDHELYVRRHRPHGAP